MADHFMFLWADPVDGRDDEFNKWYDEIHLAEVLTVEGFAAAQRYKAADNGRGAPAPCKYLTVYEIEGDAKQALRNMKAAAPNFNMSDSLDTKTTLMQLYSPSGERHASK